MPIRGTVSMPIDNPPPIPPATQSPAAGKRPGAEIIARPALALTAAIRHRFRGPERAKPLLAA